MNSIKIASDKTTKGTLKMITAHLKWTAAASVVVIWALLAFAAAPETVTACGGCGVRTAAPAAPATPAVRKTGCKGCPKCPAKAPTACKTGCKGCPKCPAKTPTCCATKRPTPQEVNSVLATALKAAEAGDAKAAAAEIVKARKLLAAMAKPAVCPKAAASPKAKAGQVVNASCPMMGNKIDPTKMPVNLTREFDGKKVGFCCVGCPAAWDKLPDAAKTVKLKAAM